MRLLRLLAAVALLLPAFAPRWAGAQEASALTLELNKLEPVQAAGGGGAGCRAYLVASDPEGGPKVDAMRLDLVLFGTDGVRGVAGELLTAELALKLGRAVTAQVRSADPPRVLLIRDPRESGQMLEAALAAGITAAGGEVLLGGVLPTPAAPLLLRSQREPVSG